MKVNEINRCLALGIIFLPVAALVVAGCRHPAPTTISLTAANASYAGNVACKPCHAGEYASHHLSFHANSVHLAEPAALGSLLPTLGVVPLAGYALESSGDALEISRATASGVLKQKLDLVLGSGKLGMTYISILDGEQLMETRMSYFPPYKVWDRTPGQEIHVESDKPFGRVDDTDAARKCLGCHTTALPERGAGLMPEKRLCGIGCESCHGPGKAHIDAANAGRKDDLKMVDLSKIKPSELNALCGKCHRNASDIDVNSMEANETHRFQPFALQRSACRTAHGEPLSCVYCHDAHTNVSTDIHRYEIVCLSCHSKTGKDHAEPPAHVDVKPSKVCPVNANAGCIACHMRPKTAFPLTTIPAKMADHLITPPGAQEKRVTPRIDVGVNSL